MNFIRQRIDAIKKPFGKGQKWERFAPAVNAFDTFLFVPNHTTQKGAHIRDGVDLKRTMITVILAMVPALLFGISAPLNLILPATSNFSVGELVPIPTLPSFFIIILVSDNP